MMRRRIDCAAVDLRTPGPALARRTSRRASPASSGRGSPRRPARSTPSAPATSSAGADDVEVVLPARARSDPANGVASAPGSPKTWQSQKMRAPAVWPDGPDRPDRGQGRAGTARREILGGQSSEVLDHAPVVAAPSRRRRAGSNVAVMSRLDPVMNSPPSTLMMSPLMKSGARAGEGHDRVGDVLRRSSSGRSGCASCVRSIICCDSGILRSAGVIGDPGPDRVDRRARALPGQLHRQLADVALEGRLRR